MQLMQLYMYLYVYLYLYLSNCVCISLGSVCGFRSAASAGDKVVDELGFAFGFAVAVAVDAADAVQVATI